MTLSIRSKRTILFASLLFTVLAYLRRRRRPGLITGAGVNDSILEEEWDIVIVGGGTAGCVLAARLSERPDLRVLLLEAGVSGKSIIHTRIPAAYPLLFKGEHDWNLSTVPQKHCLNRKCYWPRGKLLGGCSNINAMMYHYGAPQDFKEWVPNPSEPGATDWTYEKMMPYYRKFEKWAPRTPAPLVDLSHRGDSGALLTGFNGSYGSWSTAFVESCKSIGIPESRDLNTLKGSLGVSKIMTYISSTGERSTTETGYLTSEVLARPNLRVITGAHVTRLILTDAGNEKRVQSVEFALPKMTGKAKRYRVRVKKEAILSAGAVHTPHILMLSGIGAADHLSQHAIPVQVDLPGVGQHLKDHPVVEACIRSTRGSMSYLKNPKDLWSMLKKFGGLGRWLLTGGGPLTSNLSEAAAFLRSDDEKLYPKYEWPGELEDSTSGPGAPDIELIAVSVGLKKHGTVRVPPGQLASIGVVLLRPTSKGSITLNSSDPFEPPLIDPNYLATPHDVAVLVRGLRLALQIMKEPSLEALRDKTEKSHYFDHELDKLSNKQLEHIVRERAETLYHPTSTARMAPLAEGGVVDYYLRVRGVTNLRIADDSVLPELISGHTAGPAIAIGEKCADLVKETWR